jgi:hypothetical protein
VGPGHFLRESLVIQILATAEGIKKVVNLPPPLIECADVKLSFYCRAMYLRAFKEVSSYIVENVDFLQVFWSKGIGLLLSVGMTLEAVDYICSRREDALGTSIFRRHPPLMLRNCLRETPLSITV